MRIKLLLAFFLVAPLLWATPERARFDRPAGVRVRSGFYLYVQPGSETCSSMSRRILAFRAPWTAAGLRARFTYERVVSPCLAGLAAERQRGSRGLEILVSEVNNVSN